MRDQSITRMNSVTPSDTADLGTPGIGLYVGVSGDVTVTTTGGDKDVMPALAAGMWHPVSVAKVWATDTDATGIKVGW